MKIIIEDTFNKGCDGKIKIFYADDKYPLEHCHQESPILDIPVEGLIIKVSGNNKCADLKVVWYDNSMIEFDAIAGKLGPYESIKEKYGRKISPDASTGKIELELTALKIQPGSLSDPDTTVTIGDAPPTESGKKTR